MKSINLSKKISRQWWFGEIVFKLSNLSYVIDYANIILKTYFAKF